MPEYRLNQAAVKHARRLIDDGEVDAETGWSEGKPSPGEGTTEIDEHGYDAYGRWFLGIDPDSSEDTKQRYHFPVGDFSKVYRQGLVHAQQRAAQNDHDEIAKAAKQLLEHLDDKLGIEKG
jgi:hypothetical protein